MSQLGDALSEERRRQGKSLVDVEAGTRIRARALEALEHGDYDQLPAPAYVKGYIQSYAKYLDIPAQPLLEMYKVDMRFADEREEQRDRTLKMPRGASYSKVSRQNFEDLPAEPVVPRRDQAHAIPMRTWLLAAGGILTLFLVLWGVSKMVAAPSSPPPVPTTSVEETTAPSATASTTSEVASTPVTPVEPSTVSSGDASTTPASNEPDVQPFKLTFRLTKGHSSHLKVTVDGRVVFDEDVQQTSDMPSLDVYREAIVVLGRSSWITTMKDGQRVATPNGKTDYKLTIKNDSADSSSSQ